MLEKGNKSGIKNWTKNMAVVGLLVVVVVAMAAPAGAVKDLVINGYNKGYLTYTYWTPYDTNTELLGWKSGQYLDASYKNMGLVGYFQATMVSDNTNQFTGECVSLAKALSKSNVPTTSTTNNKWTKGRQVMSGNVAQGTVIAKFNADGTYDASGKTGHVAIFDIYIQGQGPAGFRVWDQNFVYSHRVGRHILYPSGSGVMNANNYYVVQVPS